MVLANECVLLPSITVCMQTSKRLPIPSPHFAFCILHFAFFRVILSGESGSGDASRFAVEPRRGAEENRVAIPRRDLLEKEVQCLHQKGVPSFVDPAPLPFRALPWVGFDYEKHHPVVFFSAQDDTEGVEWWKIQTVLHSQTSPHSTIGEPVGWWYPRACESYCFEQPAQSNSCGAVFGAVVVIPK